MTAGPESDFTLDEQLCFALYSASRAMAGAYRDRLAQVDLTYTQYVVLLLLWEHHSLPMGQLGHRLHLDSATLSPVLKRLAARHLVTRTRSARDERTVEITCTDGGYALRERVRAVQSEVQRDTGLSTDDLVDLRDDLHRLAHRLRDDPTAGRPTSTTTDVSGRPDAGYGPTTAADVDLRGPVDRRRVDEGSHP